MKTIVYVDGFNLFYGLIKGTSNMWLDLELFVRSLLTAEYDIVKIKYFTARVRGEPIDTISVHDQHCYLLALAENPVVKIIEGYYRRYRAKMPFAKDPCKSCNKVAYATVWKVEEKKSDVNIAVEMTSDAYENRADAFVLISGDADHAAALSAVRHRLGKKTVVFNPHVGECVELRKLSTYYRNIPRDLPAKCQLPYEVTLANGRTIHKPAAWTPGGPGGS